MKARNLFLFAMMTMMAMATCKATNNSPDLTFLKKIGVQTTLLTVINDAISSDNPYEVIMLDDSQALALLPQLQRSVDPEAGLEGTYYIEAGKALTDGYTMLFMGVEYGDGGNQLIGIYDKNGKLTDLMDNGNWGEFYTMHCNDEMTQGQARITHTTIKFSTPNDFSIDSEIKLCDWTRDVDQEELPNNFTKQYWKLTNKRTHSIDKQGHIVFKGSKTQSEGEMDGEFKLLYGISEIGKLPFSDSKRIDRLNEKANEMARMLNNHEFDLDFNYYIRMIVNDIYAHTPQQLLQWIYDNRNTKNHIVEEFEQIFSDSWRDKYMLVKDIERMTDKKAQSYLERLTSQWGPSDAVG